MTIDNFNTNLPSNLFTGYNNLNANNNSEIFINNEIKPQTYFVYSYIPAPYVKEKYTKPELDYLKSFIQQRESDPNFSTRYGSYGDQIPQIIKPKVIDINYDDPEVQKVCNSPNFFGESITFYKDGILVSSENKIKTLFDIVICRRNGDFMNEVNSNCPYFEFMLVTGKQIFIGLEHIEHLYKMKNNLKLYVVCPKFSKSKALVFEFKNNQWISDNLDYINENLKSYSENLGVQLTFSFLKSLPEEYVENYYLNGLGCSNAMHQVSSFVNKSPGDIKQLTSVTGRKIMPNKKELLIMGYNQVVFQNLMQLSGYILSITKSEKKEDIIKMISETEKGKLLYENYLKKCVEAETIGDLCKIIIDKLFDELSDVDVRNLRATLMKASSNVIDDDKVSDKKIVVSFYNLCALLNLTKKGTAIPFVGPINYQKFSEQECIFYWPLMSHTLLVSGWAETNSAFKILRKSDVHAEYGNVSDQLEFVSRKHERKKIQMLDEDTLKYVDQVILEIERSSTGEYIPYNAAFEIKDDPQFKYVRFIENERLIMFFVTDSEERVLVDVFNKKLNKFGYWILNNEDIDEDTCNNLKKYLYPKIISAIRDWKILIERDSTMMYRGKRVPQGVNSDTKRYIYLPRVRYKRNPNKERIYYDENKKFSGDRRAHIRKLPQGSKPSKFQLLLAYKSNVPVPPGYTFVKESMWGVKGMTQKEKIYRSKSLHGMMFIDSAEQEKAIEINDLSPAAFEEEMSKFMGKRGWEIVERNNYDGGIDIRGFKEFPDGTIKKLIVQCKHWKKAVGPDVIRELLGAAQVENDEYEKVMMVITSSRFTPGAIEIANEHKIELIDGDMLIN